jgi:hypothetical protein
MTLVEAATIWEENKRLIEQAEPKLKSAAKILKEHFRRTGKSRRGNIGYALTTYKALDVKAVRAHLGDDVAKFEERRERETLSLLR